MIGQISNFNQVASIRRMTINSGRSAGLNVIDCDNGKIRFLLNESKALDVMQLYHEGQNVSYVCKNGFTTKTYDFSDRFEGGMVYTCGLDGIGDIDGLEPHGTYHNQPAEVIHAECNEDGILVIADVYFTRLFGRSLKMRRKVYTAIGSETLEIEDTLLNLSKGEEDYSLLYHVNLGYPFLDEGVIVIDDPKEVIPRTPYSAKHLDKRTTISAPVDLDDETCYFISQNTPKVSVENKKLGKKFTLEYSGDTLTHFVQWKSLRSEDYALGLEPATSYLDDGFAYKKIKPNESITFKLSLSVNKL